MDSFEEMMQREFADQQMDHMLEHLPIPIIGSDKLGIDKAMEAAELFAAVAYAAIEYAEHDWTEFIAYMNAQHRDAPIPFDDGDKTAARLAREYFRVMARTIGQARGSDDE